MWYSSFFKNHWFFSFTQNIKIKSSGKLYLKSGCIAYTSKGVLKTKQILNQTYSSVPVDLSLMNDSCCNVFNFSNRPYPKPIHYDEIKNIKFNKDAFNKINNQLDQQDISLNLLIVDKTCHDNTKFYLNRNSKKSVIENINLSYSLVPNIIYLLFFNDKIIQIIGLLLRHFALKPFSKPYYWNKIDMFLYAYFFIDILSKQFINIIRGDWGHKFCYNNSLINMHYGTVYRPISVHCCVNGIRIITECSVTMTFMNELTICSNY
ncbi:Uncharacterized protein FWK35_00014923 [Aphis craccivora]|uniref:Uncharacterized protein n=1 Tax=Aphis craccivora TaxID=307492 RepID=A0A6G0YGN6_APHCR|nr:Uncharacterized protein FWK35_00014923 [Aphis craccivora]